MREKRSLENAELSQMRYRKNLTCTSNNSPLKLGIEGVKEEILFVGQSSGMDSMNLHESVGYHIIQGTRNGNEDWKNDGARESFDTSHEEAETDSEFENDRLCVCCLETIAIMALLPCQHVCICGNCSVRLSHCPICRAFIDHRFRIQYVDKTD